MRKGLVHLLALSLVCAVCLPLAATTGSTQSLGAIERGYRTGYSDGYVSGYRDTVNHAQSDYRGKQDFLDADRAWVAAYGDKETYRDGYQQGFSIGYDDGYQSRGFNSAIPRDLTAKGTVNGPDSSNDSGTYSTSGGSRPVGSAPSYLPDNTVLLVELMDGVSTERSNKGDRFQMRVIEPAEFEGMMIDGHIEKVERPGKVKGTAQLQLRFDTIRPQSGPDQRFNAQVVEVVPMNPDDRVETVDPEGGVKGKASKTADAVKVGMGTAIGAVIGAIAGGGKGAAIGAAIGGGAGGAAVLTSRGREIDLTRGQQLRIRTVGSTKLY
jgi:hypothetical protein